MQYYHKIAVELSSYNFKKIKNSTFILFQKITSTPELQIVAIITILFVSGIIASSLIPSRTMILGGEYIFSFDYTQHVANIIDDYKALGFNTDNTNCNDCPDFYHYSRWYSLFKIGYISIGEILLLHPFIFLIFSSIVLQLTALFVFTRIILGKYRLLPFLAASFFFIFNPYKFSLLIETHDGTLYASTILILSLLYYAFTNLAHLTTKSQLSLSILLGILYATFFNINIAFLPIIIYMSLAIFLFTISVIIKNLRKFYFFISPILFIAFILNLPLFHSLFSFGNTRHYSDYLSFSFLDSFVLGKNLSEMSVKVFILIVILLLISLKLSYLSSKKKFYLLVAYSFFGLILLGSNSIVNIYEFLFTHFPLMDSLRSTYRFYVFQMLIVYIFVYTAIFNLSSRLAISKIFIVILCIALPSIHIVRNTDYFFIRQLPEEYFDASKYLNLLEGQKIYLPLDQQGIVNVTNRFSWSDPSYTNTIVIYKNPFSSLVPVRDLIQFEKFPLLSPNLLELRSHFESGINAEALVNQLARHKIRYIIYDQSALMTENSINIKDLLKSTRLEKKFGKLYILRLPDDIPTCSTYFGDFDHDKCLDLENPDILINRSKQTFAIHKYREELNLESFELNKSKAYYNNVLNPQIQSALLREQVSFSKNVIEIPGNQTNILFRKNISQGPHTIYLSTIELQDEKLAIDTFIVINVNGKPIKEIHISNSCNSVISHKIDIVIPDNDATISIDVVGKDYVLLNDTPLLADEKTNLEIEKIAKKSSLPEITRCQPTRTL